MARSHWDGMFLPSVREEGSANSHKHQYILAPVHGQLVYDRISGKQRKKLPVRPRSWSLLSAAYVLGLCSVYPKIILTRLPFPAGEPPDRAGRPVSSISRRGGAGGAVQMCSGAA
jgi:hypothetical protein